MDISSIFFNMKIYCVFTEAILMNTYKIPYQCKKNKNRTIPNTIMSAAIGFF